GHGQPAGVIEAALGEGDDAGAEGQGVGRVEPPELVTVVAQEAAGARRESHRRGWRRCVRRLTAELDVGRGLQALGLYRRVPGEEAFPAIRQLANEFIPLDPAARRLDGPPRPAIVPAP